MSATRTPSRRLIAADGAPRLVRRPPRQLVVAVVEPQRHDVAGDDRHGDRRTARNTCSTPSATWPPTGSEQPEPSSARKLRSTSTAWRVAASSTAPSSSAVDASSPARHSTATQPCPTAGTNSSTARRSATRSVSPSTCERGDGHHDRPAVGHLRRGGWRCCRAAATNSQVRAGRGELGPPAHRPGGDGRALGQPVERAADQRVGGVPAAQERPDRQRLVGQRRQVLGRVHGDVGPPVEHGVLDLLDEHALPADDVQRHVLAAVAGRLDEHQLDVAARRPAAARRRRPGPGCGPAGCRGWPGAGAVSTRPLSAGRRGRSRRPRCARPWACRRRGGGARTGRAGAWRRWCGSAPRPPRARCRRGR